MRQQLSDHGPEAALTSLSPSNAHLAAPPRVVFDKLHHSVITPARTPVLLVPSHYGAITAPDRGERTGNLPRTAPSGGRAGGGRHPGTQPATGPDRCAPGATVSADRTPVDDNRRPGRPDVHDPPAGFPPSAHAARPGPRAHGTQRTLRALRTGSTSPQSNASAGTSPRRCSTEDRRLPSRRSVSSWRRNHPTMNHRSNDL